MLPEEGFIEDEIFGPRLLISLMADRSELEDNLRAARSILSSFDDVEIKINPHRIEFRHRNPEYLIDNMLGDRKGIEGEQGVTNAFQKALKQNCEVIVLDLDHRLKRVKPYELSKYIVRRKENFKRGAIKRCYVVFGDKAIFLTAEQNSRICIEEQIKKLEPRESRSSKKKDGQGA